MLAAKFEHRPYVEGVAESVGDHHGLRFARDVGGLQLLNADVARDRIVVDEHGYSTQLENRRNGRRKTRSDRDHFIPVLNPFMARQLVGRERGEGHKVRGGTGINQERELHAEEGGEFLFEGFAFGSEGEPKVEGGADGSFYFILIKNPAGIWHGGGARDKWGDIFRRWAIGAMRQRGVFPGQPQNFRLKLCRCLIHGSMPASAGARRSDSQRFVGA